MATLTKQERMFFDRVSTHLMNDPSLSVESAAQRVLDEDTAALNKYMRMRQDERAAFTAGMCSLVYDAITAKKG